MLEQQIKAIGLSSDSKSLFLLSPSFDASVSDFGTALLAGAALCIESDLEQRGRLNALPEKILQVIAERGISYVDLPPSLLAMINPDECPSCLQTILIGGEVADAEMVRQWSDRVRLVNVYGPTEATVCTSFSICNTNWDRPLIGMPLDGVVYEIDVSKHRQKVNASDQGLQVERGELLIGGLCLATGYRLSLIHI